MRDPPVVYLMHGWILYLSANLTTATTTRISHVNEGTDNATRSLDLFDNNDNDGDDIGSLTLAIMIVVGNITFCVILALTTCILVGLLYIKQKR